jgi:mono/diheme cytochrome c family protein
VWLLIRSNALESGRRRAAAVTTAPGVAVLCAIVFCAAAPAAACFADESGPAIPGGVDSAGAAVFATRCAVCHGPQAGGIPGTFPSLHEQVVAFAKIPQGRDYLVMVVTTGLMGNLNVGGVSYNGVMPPQSGLSEAEIAAVLNYLASDLGKNDPAAALSAADVTSARARHADKSAQATRALRPATDPATSTETKAAASTATNVAANATTNAASQSAGVDNPQRAWQHWTLNCQGCHRPDGSGSAGTAPSLAGTVARFLSAPGGREYLGRVPGVATSPLSNADLSEVINWMLWRFDREHLPANFQPYTAAEIGQLRTQPLRLEASQMRALLLKKADESATP